MNREKLKQQLWAAVDPVWRRISPPVKRFTAIDGEQRAAAFAYYAFFSLIPLILLLATLGSLLVEREEAANLILGYLEQYLPLTEQNRRLIIATLNGIIAQRGQVGVVALLVLVWGSMRFFYVLVRGVNRAWGTQEHRWWRLPLKNLTMLGIVASALFLGLLAPAVLQLVRNWLALDGALVSWVFDLTLFLVPLLVLFYGFSMLFKLAPRRYTRFSEVWLGALTVTILLRLCQQAFLLYAENYGNFNAFYGAFGAIVAFLLWIYLSGFIIILGGCICATQDEIFGRKTEEKK